MRVDRLRLTDFRSYDSVSVEFSPGLTAILGANGQGKTNLLEAIAFLGTLRSFRDSQTEVLVRVGAPVSRLAATLWSAGRALEVAAEIPASGRVRAELNGRRVRRRQDLLEAIQVTVFTPDDLDLIKGGPHLRRGFLDAALVARRPRLDALCTEVERILRQRNALLRQMAGRTSPEAAMTLDVWDQRLAERGTDLARHRAELVGDLGPVVEKSYLGLAERGRVELSYEAAWAVHGLEAALSSARPDDVRRGVSTVGPHRDELSVRLDGMVARSHASQGEQRSLAFALRAGVHELLTRALGEAPVLLLDDVFSELDPRRGRALMESLPDGQTLLTTAGDLPAGAVPDAVVEVGGGSAGIVRP